MNDITALTQQLRATAEKANEHGEFNMAMHTVQVLALVETLEKAQAQNKMHHRAEFTFMNALGLIDGATRDDILPAINAIKYLLNNANDKIASLESRTVTVKLPPRVDSSNVPFTAHTWSCCLDAVEKCLAAAGIQVIEGEGQ